MPINIEIQKSWTLQEGIEFCRELEKIVNPLRYYTALTGSVLQKGHSDNDLDIVLYTNNLDLGYEELLDVLYKQLHLSFLNFCSFDDPAHKLVFIAGLPNKKILNFFITHKRIAERNDTILNTPNLQY